VHAHTHNTHVHKISLSNTHMKLRSHANFCADLAVTHANERTHTNTHAHNFFSLSLSRALARSLSRTCVHSLFLLALSVTHTLTHIRSHAHINSHTHTHTPSVTHTLPHTAHIFTHTVHARLAAGRAVRMGQSQSSSCGAVVPSCMPNYCEPEELCVLEITEAKHNGHHEPPSGRRPSGSTTARSLNRAEWKPREPTETYNIKVLLLPSACWASAAAHSFVRI